jgi:hypothetical protein
LNVRRIPLDPPWLIVPIIGGVPLGAIAGSNASWSILVVWGASAVAVACGTFGLDRWYARTHPRRPR